MAVNLNDDEFDLSMYTDKLKEKTDDEDAGTIKDCCGRSERGFHIVLLRVVSNQGVKRFPYGGLEGMDELVTETSHEAVVHFQARLGWGDGYAYRSFRVVIRGRNLDKVLRDISIGRRTIIHPGEDEENSSSPFIASIDIETGKDEQE